MMTGALSSSGQVTGLLRRWRDGDQEAFDALLPLVYDQLRKLAGSAMARSRRDHTLQPTAVVNEAYLRLAKVESLDTRDRSHFFAVAARAMRFVLVDHARRLGAGKRSAGGHREPLPDDLPQKMEDRTEILDVHRALEVLEASHPRAAKLVELRFFGGLSEGEAAEVLKLSRATVTREWRFARLWLKDRLTALEESGS
ncbi:MAG: ECF-type sigma factor [Acidobacteriota bacterium]